MSDEQRQDLEIRADSVRACLRRVLACRAFAASPKIQRFLAFVVEAKLAGDGNRLKAYTIGVEVFERPPSFDPQADSLVRVSATRLREMLAAYYDGEGQAEPVRIVLRKGAYLPEFVPAPACAAQALERQAPGRILLAVERLKLIGPAGQDTWRRA